MDEPSATSSGALTGSGSGRRQAGRRQAGSRGRVWAVLGASFVAFVIQICLLLALPAGTEIRLSGCLFLLSVAHVLRRPEILRVGIRSPFPWCLVDGAALVTVLASVITGFISVIELAFPLPD